MRSIAALALSGLLSLWASAAMAQANPSVANPPMPPILGVGPGFDPSNPAANTNALIAAINKILLPLVPPVLNGVNFPQLTSGVSGVGVTIAATGSDANIAIKLQPQGNGNIVLFDAVNNLNSTGVIKVGNLASWRPMTGLANCPGVPPNQPPLGMADHVTGYLVVKDWLDRPHGFPGC